MSHAHSHGKAHSHSHSHGKDTEVLAPDLAKLKRRASYVGACMNILQTLIKITLAPTAP